jgi:hypothetical protein
MPISCSFEERTVFCTARWGAIDEVAAASQEQK